MKIIVNLSSIFIVTCFVLFPLILARDDPASEIEIFQEAVNSQRSQSLYPESDFNLDEFFSGNPNKVISKRYTKVKVADLDKIDPKPDRTKSPFYVSPKDIDTRVPRSSENEYNDGYKEFLAKYFSRPDEDSGPDYRSGGGKSEQYVQKRPTRTKDVERVPRKRPVVHRQRDEDESNDEDDEVEDIRSNNNDDDDDESESNDGHSSEYERIKELSQKQEQELKQNPKNCKIVVKKDNMRCSVCMNPETGAHSESCSYSSTPPEKKYAYTKERNYNSKDNEPEDGEDDEGDDGGDDESEEENTANGTNKSEKLISTTIATTTSTTVTPPSPYYIRRRTRLQTTSEPSAVKQSANIYSPPTRAYPIRAQPVRQIKSRRPETANSNATRFSSAYRAEESRIHRQVIGLDPFLYGGPSDSSSSADDDTNKDEKSEKLTDSIGHSYDDYFAHVFPNSKSSRLTKASPKRRDDSSTTPDDDVEFLPNYDTKENVEKVLADFKKKDWSKCDKEQKGDLTCYQCKDERGVRHEECIFVSTPQTSRLTYLETKKYKDPNSKKRGEDDDDDDEEEAESHGNLKDINKEVITDRSIIADSNAEKRKSKRKLVSKKRKAKLARINQNVGPVTYAPRPEDVTDHQASNSNEKQTIKRTVSYRIENNNEQIPAESRVMVYEHKMSHVS